MDWQARLGAAEPKNPPAAQNANSLGQPSGGKIQLLAGLRRLKRCRPRSARGAAHEPFRSSSQQGISTRERRGAAQGAAGVLTRHSPMRW
jgi:hypothetical protein